MPGWVGAIIGFAKLGMEWLVGKQKADERQEHREAGRQEQQNADMREDRRQSAAARDIRADVARASESELDDELRADARPADRQ